jgi:hypothetical protein
MFCWWLDPFFWSLEAALALPASHAIHCTPCPSSDAPIPSSANQQISGLNCCYFNPSYTDYPLLHLLFNDHLGSTTSPASPCPTAALFPTATIGARRQLSFHRGQE